MDVLQHRCRMGDRYILDRRWSPVPHNHWTDNCTGGRLIAPRHITQAVKRAQQALNIAQEKPSPKGQGGGSSNVEPPTPLPAGVISAKRELRDLLLDWTALVSEGLAVVAHCDPTEPSMLAWLGSGERADYLAAHEAAQDFLDRKSTRLNSSHVSISYAVFCL